MERSRSEEDGMGVHEGQGPSITSEDLDRLAKIKSQVKFALERPGNAVEPVSPLDVLWLINNLGKAADRATYYKKMFESTEAILTAYKEPMRCRIAAAALANTMKRELDGRINRDRVKAALERYDEETKEETVIQGKALGTPD